MTSRIWKDFSTKYKKYTPELERVINPTTLKSRTYVLQKYHAKKWVDKPWTEMIISIAITTKDLYLVHIYKPASQKHPIAKLKIYFVEEEISKVIQHMENAKNAN